jgi:hypothetical protein
MGITEFEEYRKLGWSWILLRDDHLELLHLQAWYFGSSLSTTELGSVGCT